MRFVGLIGHLITKRRDETEQQPGNNGQSGGEDGQSSATRQAQTELQQD